MKTPLKRTNWTTEEVINLISSQKIVNGNWEEDDHCKAHNSVVDDIVDFFYDFIRQEDEMGAMAYCEETGEVYHIGQIPER